MKKYITLFSLLFITITLFSQTEEQQITETLNRYIQGSSYSYPKLIESAFYEEASLFLSKKDQEIWLLSPKEYGALFEKRERGVFNGRYGKILTIDVSNNIAMAKAEISIPKSNMLFIDIFLLKKLEGKWKIISKAAAQIVD
ncbi:nuclear transport factor 2 family protein [Croceitalea rosinachiae]|uniref:Nuclear transport factor 2 family protein n=1 Tax=Croceitalea rosinachiae TaxID=3075596 RepID=A0ABU3AAL6_9FLAO|nr:nuclear transport factor 2 family protein [Croceitalea sp. F388]MDT0606118.1 nuclear transport factor 2 family protein [Croceitalea sp. F388]